MTTEIETNQKRLSPSERFALTGHVLITTGGLLISISQILMIANSGKIGDFSGNYPSGSRQNPQTNHNDGFSANEYFRRG